MWFGLQVKYMPALIYFSQPNSCVSLCVWCYLPRESQGHQKDSSPSSPWDGGGSSSGLVCMQHLGSAREEHRAGCVSRSLLICTGSASSSRRSMVNNVFGWLVTPFIIALRDGQEINLCDGLPITHWETKFISFNYLDQKGYKYSIDDLDNSSFLCDPERDRYTLKQK